MLDKKVLVLNNPTEIRNNPEKLSIFNFKNLMTKTLVSENLNEIIQFIKSNQFTILKPLYGNGGEGVEKLHNKDFQNHSVDVFILSSPVFQIGQPRRSPFPHRVEGENLNCDLDRSV